MSEDMQKPKPATPDALVKTTDKGEITLTEEGLSRACGGVRFPCCSGKHISDVTLL
jgi:hypothetical protein